MTTKPAKVFAGFVLLDYKKFILTNNQLLDISKYYVYDYIAYKLKVTKYIRSIEGARTGKTGEV